MNIMNEFINWFYENKDTPQSYKKTLGKNEETRIKNFKKLRDNYILSFEEDLFDIELDSISEKIVVM